MRDGDGTGGTRSVMMAGVEKGVRETDGLDGLEVEQSPVKRESDSQEKWVSTHAFVTPRCPMDGEMGPSGREISRKRQSGPRLAGHYKETDGQPNKPVLRGHWMEGH